MQIAYHVAQVNLRHSPINRQRTVDIVDRDGCCIRWYRYNAVRVYHQTVIICRWFQHPHFLIRQHRLQNEVFLYLFPVQIYLKTRRLLSRRLTARFSVGAGGPNMVRSKWNKFDHVWGGLNGVRRLDPGLWGSPSEQF